MPEDLLFSARDGKGQTWTVRVKASLAAKFEALYRDFREEICAAIVGRISDDGSTAICSAILGLTKGARFDVEIDQEQADRIARELTDLWAQTGGEIYYLGDWHTHPGASSEPSELDCETSQARARDPKARCPQHVMLISGADGLRCMLSVDGVTGRLARQREPEPGEPDVQEGAP